MAKDNARLYSVPAELESKLEALQSMGLAQLRTVWSEHWGRTPRLRSVELLRMIVAWRLQAAVLGGLDPLTIERLKQRSIPRPRPPTGTRLTREYRGVLHHVDVGAEDFKYAGRTYTNLTAIASEIAGCKWSGPRFFGLLKRPRQ